MSSWKYGLNNEEGRAKKKSELLQKEQRERCKIEN